MSSFKEVHLLFQYIIAALVEVTMSKNFHEFRKGPRTVMTGASKFYIFRLKFSLRVKGKTFGHSER